MRKIAVQRNEISRASFMIQVENMAADFFVWVDEIGSDKRNTQRSYAYGLKGTTPVDHVLFVRGKRISAISTRGVEDVYLVEESVNGNIFCDFVSNCLLPIFHLSTVSTHAPL